MRPIPQTTLNSSSSLVQTTTTIIDNDAENEAAKKAAAAEQLSELIQESGIEVMYTEDEYRRLDKNDRDRNPLNDLLILRKIPEANSPEEHAIIQKLIKLGDVAALNLADYIIKANGTDTLNLIAKHGGRVVALEWLLTKNPSITKLNLTIGPGVSDLYDILKKSESLRQISFLFLAPFDEDAAKKTLSQLAEKNNLQKLSITMHKNMAFEDDDAPETVINLHLHKIIDANPELESIDLDVNFKEEEVKSIFESMKNMKNLDSARFGNNISTVPAFLAGLPEVLTACTQLKNLEINGYPYEYTQQEALLDCLKNHTKIKHLTLDFEFHSELLDNPSGNQKLRAALIEHPTLISLDLSQKFITKDQLEALLSGETAKHNLHALKFSILNIGEHEAQLIARLLMTSSRLEEVKITTKNIDTENFNKIAGAISQNQYLTKFDFKISADPYDRPLKIQKIYEEKIQPKLDHNLRRLQDWAMRDKWGPAFGASENAPATAIPAEVAGLMAQHLSQEQQAEEPLGAAQRTDQKMLEILLAMRAAASAEQNANPTPNPAPNPAPSPDSSSSSSSASATGTGTSEQPTT